ncbi:sialate O-acetylesterase [Aquamicrobium defluvii]|uniref:Uncharacterized protein n=1 Tax=Aquamicrobium defluvii TaxID=69279 RepID=A0A4R6YEW1_9HYPH|nr:sialate O-acetylesterase [Aquamicrobium defluvii]TDR34657.1 hypothetical protein DES43_11388 [Aquamicrobium defluvii]
MGQIADAFKQAFRDFVTDGVPASGKNNPRKSEVRAIGPVVEEVIGEIEVSVDANVDAKVASEKQEREAADTALGARIDSVEDIAYTSAAVYESVNAGLAATTNGQQFQVQVGDDIVRYQNTSGTAVEVARYPSASSVASLGIRLAVSESHIENLDSAVSGMFTDPAQSAASGAASALPDAPLAYRKIRLADGTRFVVPVYISIEEIDLFVIVGQSNAEGRGDSSLSPTALDGIMIVGGAIQPGPLVDPVGGALTGSMWPSFANEWFSQTGRMSAFVEAATGGTALIPDQSGSNWSPSGSLRAAAANAANQAISAINSADEYTLGTVRFVWSQGEQEAESINGTTITGPLYKTALEGLATYFKGQVPEMVEMLVIRTGSRNDYQRAEDWAAIRAAQESACNDSDLLRMVYRGTYGFNYTGRRFMVDQVHYGQIGLNEAGRLSAKVAASSGPAPVPIAPSLLASNAWMDTDISTSNSRTVSHTTAVGAKMLVVAVAAARTVNANTTTLNPVTFGGLTMTKALGFTSPSSLAASRATSPLGRCDVGIYYLTEDQVPGGLSGVAGEIVASTSAAIPILSLSVFDLNSIALPDVTISNLLAGDVSPTDTFSVSLFTGAPAFVVGICCSVADSGAALTHTLTGLTEIADGGAAGSGRSGQVAFGWANVAEVAGSPISAVLSAPATTGLLHVAAFRGLIEGE